MASDAPLLFSVPTYAETVAHEFYPGQLSQDTQQDALRHMLAAGTLARKYGPEWAERLGRWHEYKTSPLAALKTALGVGQMPSDYAQDLHNNALGVALAQRAKSQEELETLAAQLAEQAKTKQTSGLPWINKAEGGKVEVAALSDERRKELERLKELMRKPAEHWERKKRSDENLNPTKKSDSGGLEQLQAEFSPLDVDYIIDNVMSGQHEPAYAEGGSVETAHIPFDEAKISSLVNALREELNA